MEVGAAGDASGLDGKVRAVLLAQARDAVASAIQGRQLDLDNPAAGAMAVAVPLANDASMKLLDVGVRVMAVQELNISADAPAAGQPAPQAAPVAAPPQATVASRAQRSSCAGSSRRRAPQSSSTVTADNELKAESTDDRAAARMPATTTPSTPDGR